MNQTEFSFSFLISSIYKTYFLFGTGRSELFLHNPVIENIRRLTKLSVMYSSSSLTRLSAAACGGKT